MMEIFHSQAARDVTEKVPPVEAGLVEGGERRDGGKSLLVDQCDLKASILKGCKDTFGHYFCFLRIELIIGMVFKALYYRGGDDNICLMLVSHTQPNLC